MASMQVVPRLEEHNVSFGYPRLAEIELSLEKPLSLRALRNLISALQGDLLLNLENQASGCPRHDISPLSQGNLLLNLENQASGWPRHDTSPLSGAVYRALDIGSQARCYILALSAFVDCPPKIESRTTDLSCPGS